ncbi:uncharacterized protein LOC129577428 [Sitodiplosis mosellana]|uniref:uncharacterized protein LOC129577428 n=1 Tax=Sitodiplosis mosellana TaxID=263140 RepID=UPI00244496CD|nr:uncharacterized protein LOC129577428 [Sitodiplosis mosellana]
MKVLIAVTFLLAVTVSNARVYQFVNREFGVPFDDYYNFLECALTQIDQYAMELDCESLWDKYRQNLINKTTDFGDCSNRFTENEKEECRHEIFASAEKILGVLYSQLQVYIR